MAVLTANKGSAPSRTLEGILCIEAGMLLFVGQDGLMKFMLGDYPVWILIFARAVVTLLVLVPAILLLGKPHRLLTPLWPWHLLRAALFAVGFSLFYAAFPFMGLAEVSTIFFSAPLITATLAAVFLKESIGLHRLAALLIGFAGVVIAMNPTGEGFTWFALFPMICAATYACSVIIARHIGEQETTLTMGLYTIAFAGLLILPIGWGLNQVVDLGAEYRHLRWAWPEASLSSLGWLGLLGSVGMVAYLLLSRAYQVASASLIAPFDYSYLPFATVMAYLVWDEVPKWSTLLGMALIIASGLYVGFREVRSARRKVEPPPTAESAFAPGNPLPPMSLAPDIED